MKFWINTVSRDHVMAGKKGGFIQAGHGKKTPLQKLKKDDYVIYYSSKTFFENGEPLQAFSAVARVKDDHIYQVAITADFRPFRKDAEYLKCREVKIRCLLEELEFVVDKTRWGAKFRFGLFEIGKRDFELLCKRMDVNISNKDQNPAASRS